jgi:hypothetical protein
MILVRHSVQEPRPLFQKPSLSMERRRAMSSIPGGKRKIKIELDRILTSAEVFELGRSASRDSWGTDSH